MDVSHIELITTTLTPWHWMTVGVVLCALELFAPTTILLWPGIAAIVTGVITLLFPDLSWQTQTVIFAVLAVTTAFAGRQFYRKNNDSKNPALLNRRGDKLIGKSVLLSDPIENGVGGTHIDGTRWRVVGPDTGAGQMMKVVDVDGSSLVVQRTDD